MPGHVKRSPRGPRGEEPAAPAGFTLFEIVLVLALLIALAAIAWPAIDGSFTSARLRTAADKVRSVWSEARLEAMRTGTIHEFRYQDEGNSFLVRTWSPADATIISAASAADLTEQEQVSDFDAAFRRDTLPAGVNFAVGTQYIDQRATLTAAAAGQNVGVEGLYSSPILFYPDGTTTDAVLHLKNEDGLFIRLALRGLTGISRSSELMTSGELLEEAMYQ